MLRVRIKRKIEKGKKEGKEDIREESIEKEKARGKQENGKV